MLRAFYPCDRLERVANHGQFIGRAGEQAAQQKVGLSGIYLHQGEAGTDMVAAPFVGFTKHPP